MKVQKLRRIENLASSSDEISADIDNILLYLSKTVVKSYKWF